MKKERLDVFRVRLLAEKSRVLEQLEQVEQNLQQFESDYFEQVALHERQRHLQDDLEEIRKALGRIENGTYGLSEVSGKPIPLERLEVLPWSSRLVEEAAHGERSRVYS
jgi:RNA polymerase-binding transcription factor DksA